MTSWDETGNYSSWALPSGRCADRGAQGEIAISLPEHIRLVMVAETPPSLTEPLIGDILRAGRDARSGPAADSGAGGDAAAGQPLQQLAVGHRGVAAAGGRPGVHPRF